jgi:cysteine synthase A
MAEELASADPQSVFLPHQFSNQANVQAHETTTGPEIWAQLSEAGLKPDAFVAGVGTGGTVMGVGRFLRRQNPAVQIHPVEPAESPTLSTGCKVGKHRIQGISDEFIPAIVNLAELDEVIAVSDGDSMLMAQKLAKSLALGVGISSGCNFLAALQGQESLGGDAVVVTVFPDDNKKYLSTDLLHEEPVRREYLSPEVELTSVLSLPPSCAFCDGARGVKLPV